MEVKFEINDNLMNVVKTAFSKRSMMVGFFATVLIVGGYVFALPETPPHTFKPNTPISSSEVNKNFADLYKAVSALEKKANEKKGFVGFSTTKTDGKAGGWTGLQAICEKDFPGSHACTTSEASIALQMGTITSSTFGNVDPNVGGAAWTTGVSIPKNSNGRYNCLGWLSNKKGDATNPNLGSTVYWSGPSNAKSFYAGAPRDCSGVWPVACCK